MTNTRKKEIENKQKKKIRDSLTRCAVNGIHLKRVNKKFILSETKQLLKLFEQALHQNTQEVIDEIIFYIRARNTGIHEVLTNKEILEYLNQLKENK